MLRPSYKLNRQASFSTLVLCLLVALLANCQTSLNPKPSQLSQAQVRPSELPDTLASANSRLPVSPPSVKPLASASNQIVAVATASASAVAQPSSLAPSPVSETKKWYRPAVNLRWQWQLTGTLNTSYPVDAYDIDLFDTTPESIQALKQQGKKVICYFSAGSSEDWRPDYDQFQAEDQGKNLDDWPGEKWLDIRSSRVYEVMQKRLDLAQSKGCDAVEPDNVDGYANNTGFGLSPEDQLKFNRFLAEQAHQRGLGIGLKNDLDQIGDLEPYFDFSVNEECHAYDECALLKPFITAGKPVLNAEYESRYIKVAKARQELCQQSQQLGLQTLVLALDLDDSIRFACWDQ